LALPELYLYPYTYTYKCLWASSDMPKILISTGVFGNLVNMGVCTGEVQGPV